MDTRKRLEKNWSNPRLLSDIMLKMSTYLSYIGDHLGELKAEYEQERAKAYMKNLNSGETASKSENLARVKTIVKSPKAITEYIRLSELSGIEHLAEIRGNVAKLELTLKNGQNLVSIGQSRLRVLENESRNQI